jgi:hypothetical protein
LYDTNQQSASEETGGKQSYHEGRLSECNRWFKFHSHCWIAWFWQDLHDDNKTCMQLSYWELILENGQ